jgi:hypothetical protein
MRVSYIVCSTIRVRFEAVGRSYAGVEMTLAKYLRPLCCEGVGSAWGDDRWLTSWFLQVGDNTATTRLTPVAVVGLGSGVANVAVGEVRCFWSWMFGCFVFLLLLLLGLLGCLCVPC